MNELVSTIGVASLACGASIALVLMLRKPMRRYAGAHAAYAIWSLVPLASLATLLPVPSTIVVHQLTPVLSSSVPAISSSLPPATSSNEYFDANVWMLGVWIVGIFVSIAIFLLRRNRFMRSLGRLRAIDANLLRAETVVGSPALVGMWRLRIVLPADFEQRYNRLERDLVMAHEYHHRAQGDAHINTLAASLRSVFWFNPLVHVATAFFVIDQEVACDDAVMARFPHARRSYAEAMLKAQLPESHPFLACHWHASNPLLERIAMLKTPSLSKSRRGLGAAIAALAIVSGSYAAWAAQPMRTEVRYVDGTTTTIAEPSEGGATQTSRNSGDGIVTSDPSVALRNHEPSNEKQAIRAQQSPSVRLPQPAQKARAEHGSAVRPTPVEAAGTAAYAQARIASTRDGNRLDASTKIASTPRTAANGEDTISNERDRNAQEIASYRRTYPPKYPAAAIRSHIEGNVVLNVHVDAFGKPTGADVVSVTPTTAADLASASATAVLQWRFNPALRAGVPVASDVSVPFTYSLDGNGSYAAQEPTRQASLRTIRTIDYPSEQARAGVEGVVYVKVRVEKNGAVSSVNVDHVDPSSATPLAAAAVAGVNTWTFNPAQKDGWDAPSVAIVPVVFSLHPDSRVRVAPALDRLDPIRILPSG